MATPQTRNSAKLQDGAVFFCILGFVFQLTTSVCNMLQYSIKVQQALERMLFFLTLPHIKTCREAQSPRR